MNDVGKPKDYQQGIYHNEQTCSSRPNGGFLEERIAKLEYDTNNIEAALDTQRVIIESGHVHYGCKCCEGLINVYKDNNSSITFPICHQCLDAIGKLSGALKATNFLS